MSLLNQIKITAIITCIVFALFSVLVESRSYNNGLIFYDLKSHIPYLPPTVSVSRGRILSSVKFSTKGSIWSTFGKPCECSGAVCGCCTGITVKQYKFDQKMCANVTFVPAKAEAQLDVYLNEKPSAKYVVSARNPSPFCIPVMMGIPMAMCVQMSDIAIKGNNLNMCMDFVVRLASTDLFEMHFQCMQMGLDGVQYLDKNGQPVIPPSNSKTPEADNYEYYDEAPTAEESGNEIYDNVNENENEIDKAEEIESEKVKDMEKHEELKIEMESHQQLQQLQQQLQQWQQKQEPEMEQQQESEISSAEETTANNVDGIEANEAENEIIDAITTTTTTKTTAATETKIDIGATNAIDADNSTSIDAIATAAAVANDKIEPTITTTTTATISSTVANAYNDSNNNDNDSDNDNGDDDDKDSNDNNDEETNYDTNPSDTNETEDDVTDENVVSTTIAAAMAVDTAEATAEPIDSVSTESSNEVSTKLQTLTESDADTNGVASATEADNVAATDTIINSSDISD